MGKRGPEKKLVAQVLPARRWQKAEGRGRKGWRRFMSGSQGIMAGCAKATVCGKPDGNSRCQKL